MTHSQLMTQGQEAASSRAGRREFGIFSLPTPGKGRERTGRGGSLELPRPRLGEQSNPLTAPRSVARPSECIWRSSSFFSSAAGAGKPGRGPRGLALPPAAARPLPATYRPRLAPSLRFRTATSQSSHSIVFRPVFFLSSAEVTENTASFRNWLRRALMTAHKVPETHCCQGRFRAEAD